ncbi:sensor histidine kinase [Prosthecobacter sp.]|uniref:sensor histidine kinase n=1 Tax=Prosthecobacter sp. TaxID=1965333 RepID=UPI002ABA30CB|nr:sensor histidine kinase [Prosthecobacter sp.]MDZ4402877.1 sensor histidine kinase [Prosthecobacter sp.]
MHSRFQPVIAVLLAHAALTFGAPAGSETTLTTLTTIADVRALTLDEAARHHPVQVRGIITYCNPIYSLGFVQDETGGIFFTPPPAGAPDSPMLAAGDRVEIIGITRRGRFSPSISILPGDLDSTVASTGSPVVMRIVRLDAGPLPTVPLVGVERINTGDFHDQFVRVRATLRRVAEHLDPSVEQLNMDASSRSGALNIILDCPKSDQATVKEWENVEAEISGVVSGEANDRSQLRRVTLLVASVSQIKPNTAAMQASFNQPVRGFRELLQYRPPIAGATEERLHVTGIVTLVHPSRGGFYLGSEQGGLWVRTPQHSSLLNGDDVDVIGFIAGGADEGVWLEDGIHRIARRAVPFAPRVSTADEIAKGGDFGSLIQVEGQLIDQFDRPSHRLLYLGAEGHTFYARLAESADTTPPLALENGSWLRLTGVCEKPNGTAARESFSLLLRENADIALISRPPWFNTQRLRWILGGVLVLTVLVSAWVLLLQRQVTRQTQVIAHQIEQKTLSDERRRIARELHDTLEQQLAGVNIHLDTVAECAPEMPAPVSRALDNARAMLTHSRTEAHRSILELRSRTIEQTGLIGAVRESIEALQVITPRITTEVEGREQRLSQRVEFQLLRIVQESITNALKHAQAETITVRFHFTQDELTVTITDDGTGFDATQPPAVHSTRFGLLGMRERAAKIRASIDIQSTPGTGSTVSVTAPIHPTHTP